jgi:hypothetical protein
MTFTPCEGATVAVEDPAAVFGAESDLIISALGAEVVTAAVLTSIGDGPLQATTTVEFGESASVTVSVVDGGFVVLDENSAHQSSGGITWTRAPLTGRVPREPVEGPGGLWGAAGGEIGDTSVLHSSDGAVWEAISTTTGFEIFDLAVGPAGFAAVAASTDPDQSTTGTQLWIGISPDGAGWDWQPIGEALGIEGGEFTYAQIAVGDEVVIVLASNSGDAEPGLFRRPLQ